MSHFDAWVLLCHLVGIGIVAGVVMLGDWWTARMYAGRHVTLDIPAALRLGAMLMACLGATTGVYAVGLFDSGYLPVFGFASPVVIGACAMVCGLVRVVVKG